MHWSARILGLSVALCALAAPIRAQTITTSAPFAILVDAESGSVLFEKNADDAMSPASMVKVMTAELAFKAIKEGSLDPEDMMTISENAWRRGGDEAHQRSRRHAGRAYACRWRGRGFDCWS